MTRREFCRTSLQATAAIAALEAAQMSKASPSSPAGGHGSWPTLRQNRCLTAVQPMPGRMHQAPAVKAHLDFGRGRGIPQEIPGSGGHLISIVSGALHCHDSHGKLLWSTHPEGLNFVEIVAVEDIDKDGRTEIALRAGRPTDPLGAAVLIAADTGHLLFRYDVEPMSYWWTMKVEHYLPNTASKQIVVCEHAYPPDALFGYIVLFEFPTAGKPPTQRWRYDFDHYTCFPFLLTADVNRDGVDELCVECHSHMWVLDVRTGKVDQFLEWDVSPANERSYGLVRFQDVNNDGWVDFFCIGNFAHHHEVLLNHNGRLELAWTHGWANSVTTSKIATTWPEPPIADVDGDGKLEMIVSMYHSDPEPRWMVRIYDAATGVLKTSIRGCNATQLSDVDGDGIPEILADLTEDPTLTAITGASLLKVKNGAVAEVWRDARVKSGPVAPSHTGNETKLCDYLSVQGPSGVQKLAWESGAVALNSLPAPTHPPVDIAAALPAEIGSIVDPPLVADIDGDGKPEIIHFHSGKVTVYRYDGHGSLTTLHTYPASDRPAIADVDGDGRLELIIGTAGPTIEPYITVYKPGAAQETLWSATLKRPDRIGMPYSSAHTIYLLPGRFTGRKGDDLYVFVGTPLVRSLMVSGADGSIVWEKGEIPGIERYYAPTVNLASVWDADHDGNDDLVFTCPDYYCVAHGPTGAALVGPAFPPKIFHQPSQGLYTLPALLASAGSDPQVCLVDGHYFRGGLSLHGEGKWYTLPTVGLARGSAEGFLQTKDGHWLLGYGRQDGMFACHDAATGKELWTYPIHATASDISACDIDGDGHQEFLFGTSHGDLIALADRDGKPHLLWKKRMPAGVGTPVIADVDGDGASEILVPLNDGTLCLLG
jgi:hypothetical protein